MTDPLRELDEDKLLRGGYEVEDIPEDIYPSSNSQLHAYNRLNRHNPLYKPVVDRDRVADKSQIPEWPGGKPFAVCLTHDVDHVSRHSPKQAFRKLLRTGRYEGERSTTDYLKRSFHHSLRFAINTAAAVAWDEDPLHCYERWLEVEASVGARSTFFFMPNEVEAPHYTDNSYRYSDTVWFDGTKCTVGEMMRGIDQRGWEIGIHPTWNTVHDRREMQSQKDQVESTISNNVVSVRQHYLNYDITRTPLMQNEAGLKFDSSIGFNTNIGFRFGTSYPWYLPNWEENGYTEVLEVPLIVQDIALFRHPRGLGLDEKNAFEYLKILASRVKDQGGVFTLSWHPSNITNEKYFKTYERILNHLKDENAWFGTMREIGEWWENHGIN